MSGPGQRPSIHTKASSTKETLAVAKTIEGPEKSFEQHASGRSASLGICLSTSVGQLAMGKRG